MWVQLERQKSSANGLLTLSVSTVSRDRAYPALHQQHLTRDQGRQSEAWYNSLFKYANRNARAVRSGTGRGPNAFDIMISIEQSPPVAIATGTEAKRAAATIRLRLLRSQPRHPHAAAHLNLRQTPYESAWMSTQSKHRQRLLPPKSYSRRFGASRPRSKLPMCKSPQSTAPWSPITLRS